MSSNQSLGAVKAISAIFLTCLMVLTITAQPAQAQKYKFKVLHTFHEKDGDGPVSVVTIDSAGNLYGTTETGGTGLCNNGLGCGVAFKLDKTGKQVWLHSYNGKNGYIPSGALWLESSGVLFGVTEGGGDLNCNQPYGCGAFFRLDKTGEERVLHRFRGTPDGESAWGFFAQDGTGNLYGVASVGGDDNYGTVFEVDPTGKETTLYSFAGPQEGGDGAFPLVGVVRDASGNLYGVTFDGGGAGVGAVYEISSNGDESLIYSFSGSSDGGNPSSALLLDSQGNLYGTTQNGGNEQCGGTGCGVVFELSPQSGGRWTEKVLYDFCSLTECADGERPLYEPLVMDAAGNLYGTTIFGGAYRNCNGGTCGVVFKLEPDRKETVLHSFTGGADGAAPAVGVTMDAAGNLYGTTELGGDVKCGQVNHGGCGVVFKITP